jgi:hypothetical protein
LNTITRETWRRRVQRAADLSAVDTPSHALVVFYTALLRAQSDLYDHLSTRSDWQPCGAVDRDSPRFRPQLALLLRGVANGGPEPLAIEARRLLEAGDRELDEMLRQFWRAPSDRQFFAKAIVQPYAQWLAENSVAPVGRGLPRVDNRCPSAEEHPSSPCCAERATPR